jgi:hypothetical protein
VWIYIVTFWVLTPVWITWRNTRRHKHDDNVNRLHFTEGGVSLVTLVNLKIKSFDKLSLYTTFVYSLKCILILLSHLRLGLPIGLFPSDFQASLLCAFLIFPKHAAPPVHLILLDFVIQTLFSGKQKLLIFWTWNYFQSPFGSSAGWKRSSDHFILKDSQVCYYSRLSLKSLYI